MATHISFVIANDSFSSWSLNWSRTPAWFTITRTQNNAASFTDGCHMQNLELPPLKRPFLSKQAVIPVKGKQCLLEHYSLSGLSSRTKTGAQTVWPWHFTNACTGTVNSPPVTGPSFWRSHLDWHHLTVALSINVSHIPMVIYATVSAKPFKATQGPNATLLYVPPQPGNLHQFYH